MNSDEDDRRKFDEWPEDVAKCTVYNGGPVDLRRGESVAIAGSDALGVMLVETVTYRRVGEPVPEVRGIALDDIARGERGPAILKL